MTIYEIIYRVIASIAVILALVYVLKTTVNDVIDLYRSFRDRNKIVSDSSHEAEVGK